MQPPSSPSSRRIGGLEDNKDKRNAKACNCKKSNCLKLYCECFANGVYCQVGKCNCINCLNNLHNIEARSQAVEATLERNPNSFRSKMFINDKSNDKADKNTSSKLHKGCHCKKSNCLKKYCECFQAGIVCTDRCRCLACKNFEGSAKRIEAAAKVEIKEKQAMLEIQQNIEMVNHMMSQRASDGVDDVTIEHISDGSSAVPIEEVSQGRDKIPCLTDANILSTCHLLQRRGREVVTRSVLMKRSSSEIEHAGDMQPLKVCDAPLSPESTVVEIKHAVLECFAENLRELIVQSLASKISESNSVQASSSSPSHHPP